MPLPSDPAYYADCYDLFNRAIAAPAGVQKICHSESEARDLRSRLHKARALSRELSKKVYDKSHILYNTSEFYQVVARIIFDERRNLWLLRLEKRTLRNEEIEEIMPVEIEAFKEALLAEEPILTMDEALEADGEKLRQLTGKDHGPFKEEFDPETNLDPSPPRTDRPRRI